jgi:hypothetical protein
MLSAERVLRAPLDPLGFALCWNGSQETCDVAGRINVNTPLMAYLLAPAALLGSREWMTHLVELLFLCAGIAATVSLAFQFGASRLQAMGAGLLLAAIPPVMPTASSAMPDIPSMALGVIGIDLFLRWKRDGKLWQAAASAAALGLAPCGRIHLVAAMAVAGLLLPDGWVFDWSAWRRVPARRALPLVAAVAVFLAVQVSTRAAGGHLAPPALLLGARHVLPNLRILCWYWAFPIPFAAVWLAAGGWKSRKRRAVAAGFLALLFLCVEPTSPLSVVVSLGAAAGFLALADTVLEARVKRATVQFALGCWLLAAMPACYYNHTPMKYLVASAPAAAILMARVFLASAVPIRRCIFAMTLVYGTVFSLAILSADRTFAEMGRVAGRELVAPHVARGEKVWFYGQWGFHWYAPKNGAQELWPTGPQPQTGDVLVLGAMEGGRHVLSRFPKKTALERRTVAYTGGRTMDSRANAGLYSSVWGPLPWGWRSGEVNSYEVWRVD